MQSIAAHTHDDDERDVFTFISVSGINIYEFTGHDERDVEPNTFQYRYNDVLLLLHHIFNNEFNTDELARMQHIVHTTAHTSIHAIISNYDERRMTSVDQLAACKALFKSDWPTAWVDAYLKHFKLDMTGNAHRLVDVCASVRQSVYVCV